jgi:4'-phosphopantetheinyl transferase
MNRGASDPVEDLFAARSRDLTPASLRRSARVLYLPFSDDPGVSRRCASVLSDAERKRADRFADRRDQARFHQRRAFRRFCGAAALGFSQPLSEVEFAETANGRPYLLASPNLWFSFSSCRRGALGAWSSTHAIGVDLEEPSKDLEAAELAREYFSKAEARAVEESTGVERLRTFYGFWSLKEAALKAIGEGLPFGLDAFEFDLAQSPRVVRAPPDHGGPEHYRACWIGKLETCIALVTRRPE